MKIVDDFREYKILEMKDGMKLELWSHVKLLRPDPQIIWTNSDNLSDYDAVYERSKSGGGSWTINTQVPKSWDIHYQDLTFKLKLMGFKHTGLFPEQAYNWNLIRDKIKNAKREVKVLNLFAYTGAASIAAASVGANVVHVDSSKGIVDWAKENLKASNLEDAKIRFLVDDCLKFVKREIRRGNKYDIILMDPPSFGRGANGEVWDIEKDLFSLVEQCCEILSNDPILFLINSYTTGLSKSVLENILYLTVNKKHEGVITSDELGIKQENSDLVLPCGIYARWEEK